jgi:uracil-DNA glycosylase family 4
MHGPCRVRTRVDGGLSPGATCPARHSDVAVRPQHPPVADSLVRLAREVASCERCPRLRGWCREVAAVKVKRFQDETYWGRPVPGFGDPAARLLIVGLAPAAHGANRTGRVFTGDRSGDFLFAALHRAGFASQPTSVHREDGLRLRDCYVAAAARCAPPANKPTPEEMAACRPFLQREWRLLTDLSAVLVLGKIALDALVATLRAMERVPPRGAYAFGHGVSHDLGDGVRLFCSYHPSQQNTFTGKLTPADLDRVLADVRGHVRGKRGR